MKVVPQTRPGLAGIVIRSLIVGLVYALASALAAFLLGPLSRLHPALDNGLVWWLTGTLLCLALAPFILRSTWSRLHTILAVWAPILFVRTLGLGIEGWLYKPASTNSTLLGAAAGVVIGLLVAWLAVTLLMPAKRGPASQPVAQHRWWGWTWRVLVVGLAYFVYYFVFGATNAMLYTRSFYEHYPQYGLNLPPTSLILLAQLLRGPLFGLGSLFIARAADVSRRQAGVWLGLLLFVVGGFGPYLETTFRTMPAGFNIATLVELFLQNFLTGEMAARLYKPQA
jgi:hypothetical protein